MDISADIPRHRVIAAVDIENSTEQTNSVRSQLRNVLFALFDEARAARGISFRSRAGAYAGEVHYSGRGRNGQEIACRIVDAPELKPRLRISAGHVALVVSQEMHRSVVRHGYPASITTLSPRRSTSESARNGSGGGYTPEAGEPEEDLTA